MDDSTKNLKNYLGSDCLDYLWVRHVPAEFQVLCACIRAALRTEVQKAESTLYGLFLIKVTNAQTYLICTKVYNICSSEIISIQKWLMIIYGGANGGVCYV